MSSPPSVLYGRPGLINQIKTIREDKNIKDNLVKYLAHKVNEKKTENKFKEDYRNALSKYLKNDNYIHLYGILVRDTPCEIIDLKKRFEENNDDISEGLKLKFLGLYSSIKINKWKELVFKGVE